MSYQDLVFAYSPRVGVPTDQFSLEEYANRSFAVFQESPEHIVIRFRPSAAEDAKAYNFHPTQQVEFEPDGSLRVSFSAGGLMQLAHHLLTWGDAVTIVEPQRLKQLMVDEVAALSAHYLKRKVKGKKA